MVPGSLSSYPPAVVGYSLFLSWVPMPLPNMLLCTRRYSLQLPFSAFLPFGPTGVCMLLEYLMSDSPPPLCWLLIVVSESTVGTICSSPLQVTYSCPHPQTSQGIYSSCRFGCSVVIDDLTASLSEIIVVVGHKKHIVGAVGVEVPPTHKALELVWVSTDRPAIVLMLSAGFATRMTPGSSRLSFSR